MVGAPALARRKWGVEAAVTAGVIALSWSGLVGSSRQAPTAMTRASTIGGTRRMREFQNSGGAASGLRIVGMEGIHQAVKKGRGNALRTAHGAYREPAWFTVKENAS